MEWRRPELAASGITGKETVEINLKKETATAGKRNAAAADLAAGQQQGRR